MNVPPLIERELRAASRRPAFYWFRIAIVLLAALEGLRLFNEYANAQRQPPRSAAVSVVPAPASSLALPTGAQTNFILTLGTSGAVTAATRPSIGPALLKDLAGVVFLIALGMGLLTADSISREKREGTLGLLILSNLSPQQIVAGKLASHGLTGFMALLAFIPVSTIAILAGGVTFGQATLTALGLLSVLFVALSAGLWVSAMLRERRQVVAAALALIALLAFGGGVVADVLGGPFDSPTGEQFSLLLGLKGWQAAGGPLVGRAIIFLPWLVLVNLLGLGLFHLAAWSLRHHWQDAPHKHIRDLERVEACDQAGWVLGEDVEDAFVRHSLLTNPRPWDASPIRWRVERLGTAEAFVWVPMLFSFLAQFGLLGAISGGRAGDMELWTVLASAGVVFTAGAGAFLAWTASRFFLQSRAQQDLEMLLTTEVGGREILAGQWAVLRRAISGPCAVLLVVSLPATIVVLSGAFRGNVDIVEYLLPPVLLALNLVIETLALFWLAMWYGLVSRNAPVVLCTTVGLVQLAPLLMVCVMVAGWQWIESMGGPLSDSILPRVPIEFLVVAFLLAKNFTFIVWSRARLRAELHLGGGRRRSVEPGPRLLAQPV